jgi:multidrug efflux pump subunit AcrA (membrane-fusion protein)
MRQRIVPLIIILLLLAIGGGGYWYFSHNPQKWHQLLVELELATPEAEKAGITASGFIEVREVTIGPEVSGRVAQLMVDEGDQVREGQVLVEIDADGG